MKVLSCLYFRFDIGLVAVGGPAGLLQVSGSIQCSSLGGHRVDLQHAATTCGVRAARSA